MEVRLDDRRQQILISVTDTGVGIPDDLLNEIFEAFRQVDGSMTREFSGTGLGLAITQRLARLHGGEVTLKSRVGHGSTFTVRLPLTAEQQP
ncbi:MAG: ATP-binding protein [Anaerolineae bacterium]